MTTQNTNNYHNIIVNIQNLQYPYFNLIVVLVKFNWLTKNIFTHAEIRIKLQNIILQIKLQIKSCKFEIYKNL